jgi:uncharacterized RDD family membrane protein YckC
MQPSNISTLQPSNEHTYLLVINGKPEGPFSLDELRKRKVKPGDFVRSAGMDDYKEAQEIPELRALFGFRKPNFTPQYFGSFDQRLLASVIDWFLVASVFIFLAVMVILFVPDKMVQIGIAFSLLIIIPIANFIYHTVMESSPKQATYGKQLLKIRVCDMEGERLTVSHAAGRNLAKSLPVLTLFIGYLYSFFNPKQQCLHDVVADTLVVRDRLI